MSGHHAITAANAEYQLYGPGSHAYAVEDSGGFHSTSYACENAPGAIDERDTLLGTFLDGVTGYRAASYHSSGAGADRYRTSRIHTSDVYGSPGVEGYANAAGKASEVSDTTRSASHSVGIERLSTATQSSTDHGGGANESSYSSPSEALSGRQVVPGSCSHDTLSSYTAHGSLHGTGTSSGVTR